MRSVSTLRVVRPTDNLAKIIPILGHPQHPYHFAFTAQHGHRAGMAPTKDNLLVFFLPDHDEWETTCKQMLDAGFRVVPSSNPYWDRRGRTFEDVDGYRVVLQNAAWES